MTAIHKALHSSKHNDWFTSPETADVARDTFGGFIDLDPASNLVANLTIRARYWFDEWDNGLKQPWIAENVFLNPPYGKDDETNKSNAELWTRYMLSEYEKDNFGEGILLVNATPDRKWFKLLWNYWVCFLDKRERFWLADGSANSPTNGNVLIYMGLNHEDFITYAGKIGTIIDPAHVYVDGLLPKAA